MRAPPSGRRADLYGLAEDWLGPAPAVTPEEGIDLLIRRYLRAFGPASVADVASWAGLQLTPVKAALERIELPEEHRPKIFHVKNPQSEMTFLVDGAVAGTWRHDGRRVRLEPFGRLSRADRDELEAEGERLAAYMAD